MAGAVARLAGVAEGLGQDAPIGGHHHGTEGPVAAGAGRIRPDKGLPQVFGIGRGQRLSFGGAVIHHGCCEHARLLGGCG